MLPAIAGAIPAAAGLASGAGGAGMMSWMGPLIGAGVSSGSSLFGGLFAGSQNQASARAQMAFQERMFRHRYRYTMQDMRKAGLNPILAAEMGGGSAPSGAGFSYPNIGEGTAASARQLAMDIAGIQLMNAQRAQALARTAESMAGARDTNAAAVIKEAEGPGKVFQKKVGSSIYDVAGDVFDWGVDKLRSMKLFGGSEGSSAKQQKSLFDNVESGSSTEGRKFLFDFPEGSPYKRSKEWE
ncbi:VP2 [Gokushovirus WZ-2015a]|nr:VP2 [Gokushovirus WZ-2015a]